MVAVQSSNVNDHISISACYVVGTSEEIISSISQNGSRISVKIISAATNVAK